MRLNELKDTQGTGGEGNFGMDASLFDGVRDIDGTPGMTQTLVVAVF